MGSNITTGSCLCSGVQFSVRGELRGVINCFCRQCQKTSGHHVAATEASHHDFTLIKQASLQWYESSDQARRGFCSVCGSNLFWQRNDRKSISIMAGTLDQPTGIATIENIFTESKSDYHALPQLTG